MNLGQKALQVLKAVAPTLALAVGGPFGPIAAAAIHVALGTTDDKDAEAALLSATPAQLTALKTAEQDFVVKMRDLDIKEEQLVFEDRANARAREIAVRDYTPQVIAGGVIVVTLIINWLLFTKGIPPGLPEIAVGRLLGTWDSALMLVLSYYFGSSSGSAAARETISKIASAK